MTKVVPRHRSKAAAVLACVVVAALGAPSAAATSHRAGGRLPPDPSAPSYVVSIEPSLAAAPDGTLWAAANSRYSGANIWASRDGQRFRFVANPFRIAGQSVGGSDVDLAVAPVRNATGHYNIYAASLWQSDSIAVSQDDGRTWALNSLGTVPDDDRPWVAADGPCTFFVAYHQEPGNRTVVHRWDGCHPTPVPTGVSLAYPADSNAIFGKIMVDSSPRSRWRGSVYLPAVDAGVDGYDVEIALSRDAAQSWQRIRVGRYGAQRGAIWPVSVATDADGVVYLAWHDSRRSYLQRSTDGGLHWSAPLPINARATTAVYPTVAATGHGRLSIAWYGATLPGDANDPRVFGAAGSERGRPWRLYLARSVDGGRTWRRDVVSDDLHYGVLCTHGVGCPKATAIGSARGLFDDFGVAISPRTAATTMVYMSEYPASDGPRGDSYFVTVPSASSG